MATTYQSLAPGVLDEVQDAPIFYVEHEVRYAAIDLLKDSGLYRTTLSMTLTAGQSQYPSSDLSIPSGTRIDNYEQCWYDQRPVYDANYEDLFRKAGTGPPRNFAPAMDDDGFLIWPEPTANETKTLYFLVSLVPTTDSSDIPDWIATHYRDAILLRAKYRLMRVSGQPWSNPDMAQEKLREYLAKLTEAKRNAFNTRRANTQAQMRPWI